MKKTFLVSAILALGVTASAANTPAPETMADNTKRNETIEKTGALTAEKQSNAPADVELTRKIRADVVAIKDISMYGQNVKIISNGGKVVLKGPVSSAAEKKAIENSAMRFAGAANVSSQIEISQ